MRSPPKKHQFERGNSRSKTVKSPSKHESRSRLVRQPSISYDAMKPKVARKQPDIEELYASVDKPLKRTDSY